MMIRKCLKECWIIVWRLFGNIEIEHEWALRTHTICIVFYVLILKVVTIYSEPSLIIVLKKFKCMCTCHTSSLTHDHHGLEYMNTLMNL